MTRRYGNRAGGRHARAASGSSSPSPPPIPSQIGRSRARAQPGRAIAATRARPARRRRDRPADGGRVESRPGVGECLGRSHRANAARRIRTCNQGIQGPPRFRGAWTISPSPSRSIEPGSGRPGARRRGLLLGLTPLVSEPSWPPEPGQAWLRIAMPLDRRNRHGLGFPQFTRIASGGYPPAPPFRIDESPALPLS